MVRTARILSYSGGAVAVLLLSLYHASRIADPPYSFTGTSRFGWAVGYSILLGLTAFAVGLPDQPSRPGTAALSASAAVGVSALGVSIPQLLLGDALLPRFVVFGAAALMVPWQVAVAMLAMGGHRRDESRDRILLVAELTEAERLRDDLAMSPEKPASISASLTAAEAAEGGLDRLVDTEDGRRPTVVVLDRTALADERVVNQAAKLHERGIRVRTLLGFYEEWLGKLPLSELERTSLMFDIGELHRLRYSRITRVIDLLLALVGLLALVALTPVVVVGNLLANRGPLLYRQRRVGRHGREFTIVKFRTMGPDGAVQTAMDGAPLPPGPPVARWTEVDDPRVTPFGRLLRQSHLDELPQVLNILRGDLSVVGPRPEQPHYVDELSAKLPFYDLRHLVRPGLTGWAQVKYGYAGDERDALEKLQYEFFYLRRQNLAFDARIMTRTLRSLIGGEGGGR